MRLRGPALASCKLVASWQIYMDQVLPHSGRGCWGESRRWGKTPQRSPQCCQPGTFLIEELVVRMLDALRLISRRLPVTHQRYWCPACQWNPTTSRSRPAPASCTSPVPTEEWAQMTWEENRINRMLEWRNLNLLPRRRSPQCTASLCGGRGRCRQPGWMESRCHPSFCSTFCRSAPSLQMTSNYIDASCANALTTHLLSTQDV